MSEIKVTITDNGTQSTTSKTIQQRANTTKEAAEKLDPKNEASTQTKKDSQVMVVAGMVASRSFNYITSNVGKWTGNSRNQETVNNIRQVVSLGASAVVSPWLTLAMAGMQLGTTAMDTSYQLKLDEINARGRRLRAGYSDDNTILGGRK